MRVLHFEIGMIPIEHHTFKPAAEVSILSRQESRNKTESCGPYLRARITIRPKMSSGTSARPA